MYFQEIITDHGETVGLAPIKRLAVWAYFMRKVITKLNICFLLLELIGKNKGIKIRLCTKYVTMKLQEMYVCNAMYESHGKAEKHFKISH